MYQISDLAQALDWFATSLSTSSHPFEGWIGGADLLETLRAMDESPTYPWRLDRTWLNQLAERATVVAGDVRRLGRPTVNCLADELVLAAAIERVLAPEDRAAIAELDSRPAEAPVSTSGTEWNPATWFTALTVPETALVHGEATSTPNSNRNDR